MGNRPAIYWILVLIGVAAMAAAFALRGSTDPRTHSLVEGLRYSGVVIVFIAVIFFRGKAKPTPPMPRD